MVWLTAEQHIRLIFIFWTFAQLAHLIGFLIANKDDIVFKWKVFFIGDVVAWLLLAGVVALLVKLEVRELWIWVYYLVHIFLISTILSDIFTGQDTFFFRPIKEILVENLIESITIPWVAGLVCGGIGLLIFKNYFIS